MKLHRNAKLGLAGRYALVQAVEQGHSLRAAAATVGVSPATACRWARRWREAGAEERRTRGCLYDRSSRPRRMPRLLATREQRRICAARRRAGWGPRLLTLELGHPHSTIAKELRRHGLTTRPRAGHAAARRYEWPCPGDLLHMDVARYARLRSPGHAATGERSRSGADRRARVGYDFAHAIVDDHSRYAYVELLPDERGPTVVGFLERALAHFNTLGVRPRRLMTDNAWCYTHSHAFAALLAARRIAHLRTPDRDPRPNGKVERFHQTMAREWGYGLRYRSSRHRAAALPHWLRHYNERRPHSSLGGLPPISRVHNVCGQDN